VKLKALLEEAEQRGIRLGLTEGRVHYRAPKGAITEELREAFSEHKSEILKLLHASFDLEKVPARTPDGSSWPQACLESERRFGKPHARLFPFIKNKVQTPLGSGILFNVLSSPDKVIAGVVLDGAPDRVTFVKVDKIKPLSLPSYNRRQTELSQ